MKKIAIVVLQVIFILSFAIGAYAGLKDIKDAGTKSADFITLIESIKTFNNVNCPIVDSIEAATGVDLKTVNDAQVQAYFANVTLSAAQIAVVREAAVASDGICEYITTLTLPATDN